jgi:hypothetical protein
MPAGVARFKKMTLLDAGGRRFWCSDANLVSLARSTAGNSGIPAVTAEGFAAA